MSVWGTCLRLRLCGCQSRPLTLHRDHQPQWHLSLLPRRSYNIALLESQRDDGASPDPSSPQQPFRYVQSASRRSLRAHRVPSWRRGRTDLSSQSSAKPGPPWSAHITSKSKMAENRSRRSPIIGRPGTRGGLRSFKLQRKTARRGGIRFIPRRSRTPRPSHAIDRLDSRSSDHRVWKNQLLRLRKLFSLRSDPQLLKTIKTTWAGARAAQWTADVLNLLEGGRQTFRNDEMPLHPRGFTYVWNAIALWLLAHDPRSMPSFLLATHMQNLDKSFEVQDSLSYLAMYWSELDEPDRISQLERLADAFCVLANRGAEEKLCFFNAFFRTLIRYCSDERIVDVYRIIRARQVLTHWNTYLHFTTYFAKSNHFEEAFEALMAAKEAGADLNDWPFRSNCATLLRRSSEQPDGLRVCLRIVSTLVDAGVKLNNPICDIVMLNSVEAGDLKTAFSIYHSLVERGLEPTESTFAVLLKGCKMNTDDSETLNHTIRDAIANVDVRKSPVCASEILHCLALHHSKHNPNTALHTLAEAYAQLFDLRPLYKLGLPIPEITQAHNEFMLPTHHALNFMIGATVDHYLERLPYNEGIVPIYDRWRAQVELGEPSLASLATKDYTANVFLKAFIIRADGLIHATKVMRDMQRVLPSAAGVEQIEPTVQSWSIFLHGFMRHGKHKLAEQVLNYMRSKGVEPNHVTWNTLVTGYARMQDDEATVDALRRAEQSGLVWDRWTYGGLRLLRNQQRLREELDRGRLSRQLDFSKELKEGLSDRLTESPEAVEGGASPMGTAVDSVQRDSPEDQFADSPSEIAEQLSYRPL